MTPAYVVERGRYGLGGFRIRNVLTGQRLPNEYQSQARAQRAASAMDLEFSGGKVISGYGAGRRSSDVWRSVTGRSLRGT